MAGENGNAITPEQQMEYIRRLGLPNPFAVGLPGVSMPKPNPVMTASNPSSSSSANPSPAPAAPVQQQGLPGVGGGAAPAPGVKPVSLPEDQKVKEAQDRLDAVKKSPAGVVGLMGKAENIGKSPVMGDDGKPKVDANGKPVMEDTGNWFTRHIVRPAAEIGAGALRGVDIAGRIAAPGIEANIPGSTLHKAFEVGGAKKDLAAAEGNRKSAAEAEKDLAEAQKARQPGSTAGKTTEEQTFADLMTGNNGGPKVNPKTKQPYSALEAFAEVKQAAQDVKPEDQMKNPIGDAGVKQHVDKLNALAGNINADPKQILTAFGTTATDSGTVAEKRYADAQEWARLSAGERDRELQRKIAERNHEDQQGNIKTNRDLETVEFTDPQSGERLIGSYAEATTAKATNSRKVQPGAEDKSREFYNNSARLIQNAQAVSDTLGAWDNPRDKELALRVSKQFFHGVNAAIGDFLIGGVHTAVNPEYIDAFQNSDDYKSMTPLGQKQMQNTLQLYSDILQLIKTETGGQPRGETMFETEKKILPSPEKTQEMNRQSLEQLDKRIRADAKGKPRPTDMAPLAGIVPSDAQGTLQDKTGRVVGYRDSAGKDHRF